MFRVAVAAYLIATAVCEMNQSQNRTVQSAWDNHLNAFTSQNVDKILLDYTNDSVIVQYNWLGNIESEYKGIAGVTEFFTGLFSELSDLSALEAPVVHVDENPGHVFLIWSCTSSGFQNATDTFIFDHDSKISRQNVVIHKTQAVSSTVSLSTNSTGGIVQAAWDNHFGAFGSQNIDQILLDYTEESMINVYDQFARVWTVYDGLARVRELFTGLFAQLNNLTTLSAPVVRVEENPGQVFLIWNCPGVGYESATDTFLFTGNKISIQNVVFRYVAPQAPTEAPTAQTESPTPAPSTDEQVSVSSTVSILPRFTFMVIVVLVLSA